MNKDFDKWNEKKKKLDVAAHQPPLVSEGDLWWCATGENVGAETSGKGRDFTRPIVVLKKFGRISFLGIPTTTRRQKGSWYVTFKHKGIDETAMLNQARIFSYKRLHSKMGTLDDHDFKNIKEAFLFNSRFSLRSPTMLRAFQRCLFSLQSRAYPHLPF